MFRMFCCWRSDSNDDQNLVEQNTRNQPITNESTPPRVTSSRNQTDSEDTTVQETGLQSDANIGPESSQSREDSISGSLTSTSQQFPDSEDITIEERQQRLRSVSVITIRSDVESLREDAENIGGIMSPPPDTRNPGPASSEIVLRPEDLETELQSTHRSRTNSETSSFYSVRSTQSSRSGDCDFYSVYSVDTGQNT